MSDDTVKKNISKNIAKYREAAGMSQKELAKKLGVVPSRISNWETGANCPTIDILFEVCGILNVSINDIYGVYPDSKFVLKYGEQELLKKYRNLDDIGRKHVNNVLEWESERISALQNRDSRIAELETVLHQSQTTLRIYTYMQKIACAGKGFYFDDIPTDTIEAPYMEGADFIIGVSGDSMYPTYSDGDLVYVQKQQIVHTGEIGIFILGNECYIKEAGEDGLISHNEKYPLITGTPDIQCIGKVLGKVVNT